MYLQPVLCPCFNVQTFEIEDDDEELTKEGITVEYRHDLKVQVDEMVKKIGLKPMHLKLTQAFGGDLHSNASCSARGILVSK